MTDRKRRSKEIETGKKKERERKKTKLSNQKKRTK
jgi:hypothetical protein